MTGSQDPAAGREPASTPLAWLVGAWTLVGVPLAWGVYQVFVKSLDLFRR